MAMRASPIARFLRLAVGDYLQSALLVAAMSIMR